MKVLINYHMMHAMILEGAMDEHLSIDGYYQQEQAR